MRIYSHIAECCLSSAKLNKKNQKQIALNDFIIVFIVKLTEKAISKLYQKKGKTLIKLL